MLSFKKKNNIMNVWNKMIKQFSACTRNKRIRYDIIFSKKKRKRTNQLCFFIKFSFSVILMIRFRVFLYHLSLCWSYFFNIHFENKLFSKFVFAFLSNSMTTQLDNYYNRRTKTFIRYNSFKFALKSVTKFYPVSSLFHFNSNFNRTTAFKLMAYQELMLTLLN